MLTIVGCERSGVIRSALRSVGVDAYSCDLADAEDGSEHHIKGDIFETLDKLDAQIGGFIVHPECTFLSSSGLHWNARGVMVDGVPRAQKTDEAIEFVRRLFVWALDRAERGLRFCLENPQGCIGTRLPELDRQFVRQTVQPYEFGDDASKATVFRLLNLPPLIKNPAKRVAGRMVEWPRGSGKMVERWSNQTDSGQNRLPPSETRWMDRARTYHGISDAMRAEWGPLLSQ